MALTKETKGEWIEYWTYSEKDIPIYKTPEQAKAAKSLHHWAKYEAERLMKLYGGKEPQKLGVAAKVIDSTVYVLKTPEQILHRKILRGEILTESGLKMSENQFYKLPPKYFDYYTKDDLPYRKGIKDEIAKDYHVGLVLKISGDYDPSLREDHNTWAIVTKILDRYHFEVRQETNSNPPELGELKVIRDTDVKWWIGDEKYDYVGIGEERHRREVLPLIKELYSKIKNDHT